jgi:hypothetical protein
METLSPSLQVPVGAPQAEVVQILQSVAITLSFASLNHIVPCSRLLAAARGCSRLFAAVRGCSRLYDCCACVPPVLDWIRVIGAVRRYWLLCGVIRRDNHKQRRLPHPLLQLQ